MHKVVNNVTQHTFRVFHGSIQIQVIDQALDRQPLRMLHLIEQDNPESFKNQQRLVFGDDQLTSRKLVR